jgi:DNA-binding transcriptional LysR family regulator
MRWAALYRHPPILRGVSASQIRADHAANQARINTLRPGTSKFVPVARRIRARGSKEISPNISFHVVTSDPGINLLFALDGLGITVLPLWPAKRADNRNRLVPILPQWKPEPITLCALFSGSSRLTPKVEGLLDFLAEYIGTDRDPRVKQ